MKNIVKNLNTINDTALRFTSWCLGAVASSGALLMLYCIILFMRERFVLKEIFMVRSSLEYIVASAVLSFCFGLLIDLYFRKTEKGG